MRLGAPTAFLTAAAALTLSACRRSKAPAAREPTQRLSGLTLSQSRRGVPLWSLRAEAAVLHDVESRADADEPRMAFYQDGRLASRLSAAAGSVDLKTNDVRLSSGVVVTSLQDRSVLRTEQLVYSSSKKKFYSDADVRVTRPGGSLTGRGLEATPDLSDIRIFNQRAVMKGKASLP